MTQPQGNLIFANYPDGVQAFNPNTPATVNAGPILAAPCLYWDFRADQNHAQLDDRAAAIKLTNTIGTPLVPATTSPLIPFNATGALQSDMSSSAVSLQKAIMRLDTLDTNSMIVMWCILTHGTSLGGTSTIFFWGRSGDEGWGLQAFGGANLCKLRFYHVPHGGTNDQMSFESALSLVGDVSPFNTKTALAMCITRAPAVADQNNYGKGNGLFEIAIAMQGLVDQGQFGQRQESLGFVPRIPSGTSPATFSTSCGLTFGARPTTGASTVTDTMPAGSGLDCIGFQRRKRRAGMHRQIVRQLLAQYIANPTVIVQPACLVP